MAKKRSRSVSRDAKKVRSNSKSEDVSSREPKKHSTDIADNPFLLEWNHGQEQPEQNQGSESSADELLRHVLDFTESKKSSTKSDKDKNDVMDIDADNYDDDRNKEDTNRVVAVKYLLDFMIRHLKKAESEAYGYPLSILEISLLLLPWSIKQVLRLKIDETSDNDTSRLGEDEIQLVWETLAICLRIIFSDANSEGWDKKEEDEEDGHESTAAQKILTQSTLFKLVPKIAMWAILKPDKSSRKEHSHKLDGFPEMKNPCLFSFQLLTAHSYRPTLDVACKKLLMPIVEKIWSESKHSAHSSRDLNTFDEMDIDDDNDDNKDVDAMPIDKAEFLLATLRLVALVHFSRKGNPKTSFHLLASKPVLLAFSRSYAIFPEEDGNKNNHNDVQWNSKGNGGGRATIRSILFDGLFHPNHHCHGFHSFLIMPLVQLKKEKQQKQRQGEEAPASDGKADEEGEKPKTPKFHTYQEELLLCVDNCLSDEDGSDHSDEGKYSDLDITNIVPALVNGFLQQTSEWNNQGRPDLSSASGTKQQKQSLGKIRDDLSAVQFEFIARLVNRLRKSMTSLSKDSGEVSRKTQAGLDLLQCLREIVSSLLEFNIYIPSQHSFHERQFLVLEGTTIDILSLVDKDKGKNSGENRLYAPYLIQLFQLLIRLNHELLHERQVAVISLCLESKKDSVFSLSAEFLATVFDTYRQLRHPSHVFSSILAVIKLCGDAGSVRDLRILSRLIQNHRLASSIALAVQSSPIIQVKEIFGIIMAWLIDQCNNGFDNKEIGKQSIDAVVSLCVIVFRSTRVDSRIASEVSVICERFMSEVIETISKSPGQHAAPFSESFVAPTLLLSGWLLDLHSRCAFWIGMNAKLSLPFVISNMLESGSLAALSKKSQDCKFLEELQFLAYYQLRQLHSQIHEVERAELESPDGEPKSPLLVEEAKRLATFIAHAAKKEDKSRTEASSRRWILVARCFSSWIFYANESDIDSFLRWVFSTRLQALPSNENVKTMNAEASFAMSPMQIEETECIKSLLQDLSFFEHPLVALRIRLIVLSYLSDSILEFLSGVSLASCEEIVAYLKTPLDKAWERPPAQSLAFTTSEHTKIQLPKRLKHTPNFDDAIAMLKFLNGMPNIESSTEHLVDLVHTAFRLDHVCRSLIVASDELNACISPLIPALRAFLSISIGSMSPELVQDLFGRSKEIANVLFGITKSTSFLSNRLAAFKKERVPELLRATKMIIHRIAEKLPSAVNDCAAELCGKVSKVAPKASDYELLAFRSICRSFLGSRVPDHEVSPRFEKLWDLTATTHIDLLQLVEAGSDTFRSYDVMLHIEGILLLGDLIRFHKELHESIPIGRIEGAMIQIISLSQTIPASIVDPVLYLSGCLIKIKKASKELMDSVLEFAFRNKRCNSLLNALLIEISCNLHGEELQSLLAKLVYDSHEQATAALRQRLLFLVIRYSKVDDQISAIQSISRDIFTLSISALGGESYDDGWSETVRAAFDVIEELIKRRDIFVPKERDLAVILSYMNCVLGSSRTESGVTHFLQDKVFDSCTKLLLTIFKRYTKPLYAVASSLISVMHSMFCQVMFNPLLDEASIAERGALFTRVCESLVPHKDRYKKHVVGLVLQFVHGLDQSISTKRRDILTNAVYYLLDCMSEYDTKQLNALMTGKSRELFRNIHKSYQRIHTYKG